MSTTLVVLLGGLLDVDLLLGADTFAFLTTFTTLGIGTALLVFAGFGYAFVAPLLLGFLFGAGSLVD